MKDALYYYKKTENTMPRKNIRKFIKFEVKPRHLY